MRGGSEHRERDHDRGSETGNLPGQSAAASQVAPAESTSATADAMTIDAIMIRTNEHAQLAAHPGRRAAAAGET